MIKLKNPPYLATQVLHFNKPSPSAGGKDYVLVKMANGEIWAINGPSNVVKNGGGAVQHPKKSWHEMVREKTGKGYEVIGEYHTGSWWSKMGWQYEEVQHIPIPPPKSQKIEPEPEPEPEQKKSPIRHTSLAEQYPVSDMVRKAFSSVPANDDWFCLI